MIESSFDLKIDEVKTTYLDYYRSKNANEMGSIVYSSGRTYPGAFKKSSRFVYLEAEKKFGEIFTIINCTSGNKDEQASWKWTRLRY